MFVRVLKALIILRRTLIIIGIILRGYDLLECKISRIPEKLNNIVIHKKDMSSGEGLFCYISASTTKLNYFWKRKKGENHVQVIIIKSRI